MSAVIGRVIALYVRLLMCAQALFAITTSLDTVSSLSLEPLAVRIAHVSVDMVFGVIGIAAVLFLGRGRWWAVIAAIMVEAGWTLLAVNSAANNGYQQHREDYYVAAALSAIAIIGMLLRPFRAYCGLVGHRR